MSCLHILAPLSFCCHDRKNGDHMRTLCIEFGRVSQNELGLGYLAEVGTHNTARPHTTHSPPLLSRRSPENMSISISLPPLPLPCVRHWIFAFSPTSAMAKCGTVLAADTSVATLVTSFSTKSGVIPQDNLALLSRLQIFWSPGMPLLSHSQLPQLSGGRPLFATACWHTNNQSNTTTAH